MFPLNSLVFGFRQSNIFLTFTEGSVSHRLFKPRRGEDEQGPDNITSIVGDGDTDVLGDEFGRAAVHDYHRVFQAHLGNPGLMLKVTTFDARV